MGEVNEPNRNQDGTDLTEDEIISMYESLRAVERDPSLPFPYSDMSAKVSIDWDALEKRALAPSLPERFRWTFESIPVPALAYSIVGPVVGSLATFFWLRDVPAGLTPTFFVSVVSAASVLVLMAMWAAVAMQAMQQAVRDRVMDSFPVFERAASPLSLPSFGSRRPILAFATAAAAVIIVVAVVMVIATRPGGATVRTPPAMTSTTPAELGEEAVIELVQDKFESAQKKVETISRETDPAVKSERETYLTTAEALYQKLMLLSVSDPQAASQRDILADQALIYLNRAKDVDPGRATIWTRLAEIYILKDDIEKARESLAQVAKLNDVPPLEARRAQMIGAVIDGRDISKRFRAEPSGQLARQLDKTIQEVETTQETSADAGALLAHLQNLRAGVAETPREKKRLENEALNSSLTMLETPASGLRTVERPAALTRPATAEQAVNAQGENLVQTGTSGSPPPNQR